jgi:hypothetical protein
VPGDTLVFRLEGVTSPGYLGAYATPRGSDGERIWYFPDAQGAAPKIEASREPQVVARGVTLGPEHAARAYVVHVVVTDAPVSREELLRPQGVVESRASFEILPSRDALP